MTHVGVLWIWVWLIQTLSIYTTSCYLVTISLSSSFSCVCQSFPLWLLWRRRRAFFEKRAKIYAHLRGDISQKGDAYTQGSKSVYAALCIEYTYRNRGLNIVNLLWNVKTTSLPITQLKNPHWLQTQPRICNFCWSFFFFLHWLTKWILLKLLLVSNLS